MRICFEIYEYNVPFDDIIRMRNSWAYRFIFKMDTKKSKRDRVRYLSKKRTKMMNLRRKTGQPQEERRIPDINPVETESTSQLPDVVEYFQTGVSSPSTVVSEDEYVSPSSSSDYLPTPEKRLRLAQVEFVNLGMRMFVCLTSQVASFIDQMNQNMACRTPGCNGTPLFQLEQYLKDWVGLSK